jgi:hypothetical protein
MSRLGKTTKNTQIYNYGLGRYEHEFEMEQIGNRPVKPYGLTARQRISENGTNQPIIFGASDEPTYSLQDTNKYAKKKMPMTEYQEKIGIRSNSSLFEMAHDKPYIEIADEGLKGDIHHQAPSIDLLTPNEIYKLTTVSKPSMIKPQSKLAMQKQKMAKLDEPYKIEELSRDNTDPKAYIEKNLGEKQLYPSQEPSHGDGGSNIKFDYKKEAHMGTQPKSARELYNQVYMNRKAISGINFAQRDAVKANEVLNLYSKQSPNRPVNEQTNPMEVEQKQEKQDEQKVEQIQQGVQSGAGSIVQQGTQSLASRSSPSGLVQQGIEAVGSVIMNPIIKELGLQ